jgi:predicted transposase YbfD/YdcC
LPSHDTFSRLFRLLDPAAFATCFSGFLCGFWPSGTGVVAIDGKTMRRSFDGAAGKSALHVVTAFAADTRMTIGQVAAGDKESEITAARSLFGLIDLTGALVTGDALHCQGETARLIKGRGGDWLFTLRPIDPCNTPRSVPGSPTLSRPDGEHITTDADNGRIEVRRHAVSHDVSWMLSDRRPPDEAPMPGLATLGMVESTVTRDGKTSTERRFYLSWAALDAVAFAAAVRVHRRIENCLHWVLDRVR